jgi:hypothetical protein
MTNEKSIFFFFPHYCLKKYKYKLIIFKTNFPE